VPGSVVFFARRASSRLHVQVSSACLTTARAYHVCTWMAPGLTTVPLLPGESNRWDSLVVRVGSIWHLVFYFILQQRLTLHCTDHIRRELALPRISTAHPYLALHVPEPRTLLRPPDLEVAARCREVDGLECARYMCLGVVVTGRGKRSNYVMPGLD
jgi:hypothetical protein